ncbi:MAG: PqqD family protein [Blastocatellia bacterium]|nr:PqqD family protein [Blastocatellia bacterium]
MKNKIKLPSMRTANLVVKELSNEILIYDLEKNKAFCLNETARLIMDECDGVKSIDEAAESLNRKLKAGISEEMIWMVIEQLKTPISLNKNTKFLFKLLELPAEKFCNQPLRLVLRCP